MSRRLLRKKFTYRDNTGRRQEWHANHWRGFQWQAGPVIVAVSGPWGTMQVWAVSEAEGRRVLEHAAVAGGWVLRGADVSWYVCRSSGGRNGREGLMAAKETPLGIEVSKRAGPSGFPSLG